VDQDCPLCGSHVAPHKLPVRHPLQDSRSIVEVHLLDAIRESSSLADFVSAMTVNDNAVAFPHHNRISCPSAFDKACLKGSIILFVAIDQE
jgi:hypothetical protein